MVCGACVAGLSWLFVGPANAQHEHTLLATTSRVRCRGNRTVQPKMSKTYDMARYVGDMSANFPTKLLGERKIMHRDIRYRYEFFHDVLPGKEDLMVSGGKLCCQEPCKKVEKVTA